ncbi:hypothetical protein C0Q70_20328 [Pomacea canaliculata]|uniref:Ig-like domain-containing protein n=1 Tax=Pomacea canaliculata TaxID=400727 RepID=A0A2T7NFB3_POMCA|nr:hypothetical protein C0Q70_20328 [Pomacea canaliculata]
MYMGSTKVSTTVEPTFDMPSVNVTVTEMETAILPCSVKFLGNHQIVWTDHSSTLLTFEDRRIIDDERLSVERPFTKDWNLHIRRVQYKDQGVYSCQINTVPVKIKTVNLRVEVPAKIIDYLSSEDITVRENEKVTLVCNVTGVPPAEVTWYRHLTDRKGKQKQKVGVNGEVLIIHNITRYCGDSYECVAYNGSTSLSTASSKCRWIAPEIYLPNKRIGQDLGKETILECTVTAFPHAVSIWMRFAIVNKGVHKVILVDETFAKYRTEAYEEDHNIITLSLRIFSIEKQDYGEYTCVASNKLGKDSESMILYGGSSHERGKARLIFCQHQDHHPAQHYDHPQRTSKQLVVQQPEYVGISPSGGGVVVPPSSRDQLTGHVETYRPITYPTPVETPTSGKLFLFNLNFSHVASVHAGSPTKAQDNQQDLHQLSPSLDLSPPYWCWSAG